jgi:hypothetical protein
MVEDGKQPIGALAVKLRAKRLRFQVSDENDISQRDVRQKYGGQRGLRCALRYARCALLHVLLPFPTRETWHPLRGVIGGSVKQNESLFGCGLSGLRIGDLAEMI